MNRLSLDDVLKAALSDSRKDDGVDYSQFPLHEALLSDDEPKGLVRSAQRSKPDSVGGDRISGRWIPFGAMVPHRRSLSVGAFGQGGALVQNDMQPIVALLKNRCAAAALGMTVFTDLVGNFQLTNATGGLTPKLLPEVAKATAQDPTLGQRIYSPHRATIVLKISKLNLIQSPKVEQYLRNEFSTAIASYVDRLILSGSGSDSEPMGIINTPGVGSIVYGGNYWAGVLAAEQNLTAANADVGNLGFAISGATRNKWKQTPKIGATNFPIFVMQGGQVNEYPAVATNNLADTNQSVFANWSDLLLLVWGDGIEVIKDAVTLADEGKVRFVVHFWFDVCLRRPQSFCVSADSGAA